MKKVCLIVLDGWGINQDNDSNAVLLASTPNYDRLVREYPVSTIDTSGFSVGLPEGQMGNSEVGHLTMGAGRVVYQELVRISKAIKEGELESRPMIDELASGLKRSGGALHLIGLLSDGGVHSHIEHLFGLLDIFRRKGVERVFIHAILDGRDTPPSSGAAYMESLLSYLAKSNSPARVATVCGRYYAMDRDNRWERVKKAYDAIAGGMGAAAEDPLEAVKAAYAREETDEFVQPTVLVREGRPVAPVSDGDAVLFFNFRSDRAREITRAFVDDGFTGFERKARPALSRFVCMTEYDQRLGLPVLFAPQALRNILADVLSSSGLRQFRVSETEKYAHVTFFFNGGREEPFEGEERLLIPSAQDVPTYDKKPEMRALEIAEAAAMKIREGRYSFMLMNFANCDMVGHTGVLDAAIKACEAVDRALGIVAGAAIENGWSVLITADHGNAEQMKDQSSGEVHTAHTTNLAPFILVDPDMKGTRLKHGGLDDVAPTILKLMGLPQPSEMTGKPLF
ncbi:MAG: 2,3-bisphosphoglycerate-independent phosphoglycerate mutase [Thermodesulfobacteriota bacterium]|nr:MAG: 2,3-bisphosphoglycerate-independent phosphoglycerate mutase [Thermodesulfobacteriota bacterium]